MIENAGPRRWNWPQLATKQIFHFENVIDVWCDLIGQQKLWPCLSQETLEDSNLLTASCNKKLRHVQTDMKALSVSYAMFEIFI